MSKRWHHGSLGWSCSGAVGELQPPYKHALITGGKLKGRTGIYAPCPTCRQMGRRATWILIGVEEEVS